MQVSASELDDGRLNVVVRQPTSDQFLADSRMVLSSIFSIVSEESKIGHLSLLGLWKDPEFSSDRMGSAAADCVNVLKTLIPQFQGPLHIDLSENHFGDALAWYFKFLWSSFTAEAFQAALKVFISSSCSLRVIDCAKHSRL